MTVTEASRLLHEISAIKSYLSAAQDVVKDGHMPDITGLENRVSSLCAAILSAEKDVQQQCLPQLTALLEKLNGCETSIRESSADKGGVQ